MLNTQTVFQGYGFMPYINGAVTSRSDILSNKYNDKNVYGCVWERVCELVIKNEVLKHNIF